MVRQPTAAPVPRLEVVFVSAIVAILATRAIASWCREENLTP
jgi:hypothetical protein